MGDCLGCDLMSGKVELPGGQIFSTKYWVVEHCIGPFDLGSLIVKPKRHCTHFWELSKEEYDETGWLLSLVSKTIENILKPDQVYICLWSHMNWNPVHIHFLLQPVWNDMKKEYSNSGAYLQTEMSQKKLYPIKEQIEEFASKAKEIICKLEKE